MNVLIFKTNLADRNLVDRAKPHIQNIQGINRWNVDLHDIDNILRIEAQNLSPRQVEDILQNAGYYCEELID